MFDAGAWDDAGGEGMVRAWSPEMKMSWLVSTTAWIVSLSTTGGVIRTGIAAWLRSITP
jgi:hypothetical protein